MEWGRRRRRGPRRRERREWIRRRAFSLRRRARCAYKGRGGSLRRGGMRLGLA